MFGIIKSRVVLIISIVISFIVMVAAIGFGVYSLSHLPSYDSETTGTISRMDFSHTETDDDGFETDYYDVFVTYEIDGKTYKDVAYNQFSTDMEVGDEVKIKYNAAEPEVISAGGEVILPIILFGFALVDLILLFFQVKALLTAQR